MRNFCRAVCLLTLIVALAAPLFAASGEVVKFTDGRYLEVESHEFVGEAIKLIMENRSVLILPADRVDVIFRDGERVFERT